MLNWCRKQDISMATAKKWTILQCFPPSSDIITSMLDSVPSRIRDCMRNYLPWLIWMSCPLLSGKKCVAVSEVTVIHSNWAKFTPSCSEQNRWDDEHHPRRIHSVKNICDYYSLPYKPQSCARGQNTPLLEQNICLSCYVGYLYRNPLSSFTVYISTSKKTCGPQTNVLTTAQSSCLFKGLKLVFIYRMYFSNLL